MVNMLLAREVVKESGGLFWCLTVGNQPMESIFVQTVGYKCHPRSLRWSQMPSEKEMDEMGRVGGCGLFMLEGMFCQDKLSFFMGHKSS